MTMDSRGASAPTPLRPRPSTLDPMTAYAELGQMNLADVDLPAMLTRVAELARATIAGVTDASVTLVTAGEAKTVAHTGGLALALDESQYATGFGPCLDAARQHAVFTINDMAKEARWPQFVAAATSNGVCSSLAVGVPVQAVVDGALNLYADSPGGFDEEAQQLARTFISYAAVSIANANLYAQTAALAEQMAEALKSRPVIEQAKGILMAQRHVRADEAFELLSKASQASNRKLRDLAQAIVDGTELDGH